MHFTCRRPQGDLQQGDLLIHTDEIVQLLKEVHPHYYQHPDYKYLVVLTQSCDLVRRQGNPCKSRYISLAAVRPLNTLIRRELARHQPSPREQRLGYCSQKARPEMKQFLERLLNNNEPNYFYVHSDPELGIAEPFVAFLALSIAVKAELHYDTCLKARIAQLEDAFQAKLGWLVGNMYSWVGTQDWAPDHYTHEQFESRIEEMLVQTCLWVDERDVKKIAAEEKRRQREHGDNYQLSQEELHELVEKLAAERESKKDQLIGRALEVLRETKPEISDTDLNKLSLRLKNDSTFTRLAR